MGHTTAKLIHQALGGEPAIVKAGQVSAAGGQKYALAAVGFLNTGQLTGEGLQCLIPGDALKFAFTAFTDTFLGIHQPLGVVDVLPEGPASQAGPELIRFRNVVAFDSQNSIVFDMQLEGASPATVKGRSGADDLNAIIG